jgi:hypothetical protein
MDVKGLVLLVLAHHNLTVVGRVHQGCLLFFF